MASHVPGGTETTAAAGNRARALVLVADDDPDIRRLVSRRLEHRGYRVLSVETGTEALDAAIAHLPDVVILDGYMPGLEGHEVCLQLRAREETAGIGVILLTAKVAPADEDEARSSGADAYIVKPFRIDELDDTLSALLRR